MIFEKNTKILFVAFTFIFYNCSSQNVRELPQNYSPYWNHLSEFLAGVELSPENSFQSLATKPSYLAYRKNINNYWNKIEKDYLSKIADWKEKHLTNLSPNNTTLYPLAGADFINMFNLNAPSPKYIMIGLQKPGYIRDPLRFSDFELGKALSNIQNVVYELAYYNYSTSRRLQQEANNPYFTGVAPTLLFFIKRLGYDVLNVERIYLDDDGKMQIDNSSFEVFDKKKHTGVKILFANSDRTQIKELYFFRIWLSSNSASSNSPEGKFFISQGRLNLMFKAAEYILQTKEYEPFINDLLMLSDRVVQDESGIPFRYFKPEEWSFKLYGKYIGKIQLKNTPKVPFQNDLYEAFQKESQPLPFPFGYGVLKGKASNLLLFERKSLQNRAISLK